MAVTFNVVIPDPGTRTLGQPSPVNDMNAVLAAIAELRNVVSNLSTGSGNGVQIVSGVGAPENFDASALTDDTLVLLYNIDPDPSA